MADGDLIADDQGMGVVGDMEYAEVLHIRSVADPDRVHVPANDGMEPHAAVLAQHHIADDNAGLFDKAGDGNGRFEALKCADHAAHCRGIVRQSARGGRFVARSLQGAFLVKRPSTSSGRPEPVEGRISSSVSGF